MAFDVHPNQEIAEVVANHWNRPPGGPLLISKLGMRLSPDTKAFISSSGYGLKRYMQEYLSDAIRFVPMRSRGGGVVPLADTAGLTDQQIEERYVDHLGGSDPQNAIPKYWGDVWRGFQTPLPDGAVRYVVLEARGGPQVGTSAKGAPLPANAKLIDPNDLVLPDPEGTLPPRFAVQQAIENWCRREGVPVDSLIFTGSQPKRAIGNAANSERRFNAGLKGGKVDVLSLGLSALTREELARINIPADLVLTMLERAGSQ